jgi:hypothetical protein
MCQVASRSWTRTIFGHNSSPVATRLNKQMDAHTSSRTSTFGISSHSCLNGRELNSNPMTHNLLTPPTNDLHSTIMLKSADGNKCRSKLVRAGARIRTSNFPSGRNPTTARCSGFCQDKEHGVSPTGLLSARESS